MVFFLAAARPSTSWARVQRRGCPEDQHLHRCERRGGGVGKKKQKTPRSVIGCFLIKILRPISISKSGLPTSSRRRFDNALRTAHALIDMQQEREKKKKAAIFPLLNRGYVWWWGSAAPMKKLSCRVLVLENKWQIDFAHQLHATCLLIRSEKNIKQGQRILTFGSQQ